MHITRLGDRLKGSLPTALLGLCLLSLLGCDPPADTSGNGNDSGDGGDSSGKVDYDLYSNPDDALALKATNDLGETAELYGAKDAEGNLTRVEFVRVQTADDLLNDQATLIHLDPDTGRISRIITGDGHEFEFDLSDPNRIQMRMIVAGGESQINASVDLVEPLSDPPDSPADSSGGESEGDDGSGGGGDGIDDDPLLDDDDFAPDDCRGDFDCAENEICFEGQCFPIIDFRPRGRSDCEALVNVVQCDEPVVGADVYVVRGIAVPPVTTLSTRVYPAKPTENLGFYSACLPIDQGPTPGQRVEQICSKANELFGIACSTNDWVIPNQLAICGTLAGSIDFVILGPTGEAIPIFAVCEGALNAWILSCVVFAAGDGRNPTPTLGEFVCKNVRSVVDPAAELVGANVEIQGVADFQGERVTTSFVPASTRGDFPLLTADFGSHPRIERFSISPFSPRVGEAYTISATVACAGTGTVTVGVNGDGYNASEDFFPATDSSETFTVPVPGGLSDEVHTISLVALPFGGGIGASRITTVNFRQVCNDTCASANNGICEDGGPNTEFFVGAPCELGTDCADCTGPRGECENDLDCVDAGLDPICVSHQCEECEFNTDCPDGQVCNDDLKCEVEVTDCPADERCDQACAGTDPDCAMCGFDGTCIADCDPEYPDCFEGTFRILGYFNTDCVPGIPGAPIGPPGACGQLPDLNPNLADIQLSGSATFPTIRLTGLRQITQISVVRTPSANPLLTDNVYGIASETDPETDEVFYLPTTIRYGDYSIEGTRPTFGTTMTPPLRAGMGDSYVIAVGSVDGLSQISFEVVP